MPSTHGLRAWDWQDVRLPSLGNKFVQKKSLKKHEEYQVCLLKTTGEMKKYLCTEKEYKMKYTTAEALAKHMAKHQRDKEREDTASKVGSEEGEEQEEDIVSAPSKKKRKKAKKQ